jgi:hypothetical protein
MALNAKAIAISRGNESVNYAIGLTATTLCALDDSRLCRDVAKNRANIPAGCLLASRFMATGTIWSHSEFVVRVKKSRVRGTPAALKFFFPISLLSASARSHAVKQTRRKKKTARKFLQKKNFF